MKKQKLIVLSADAMVGEDVEYLKTLPNCKKYLVGGSEVKTVRSVYPTVTYPVHTSLATGTYPNKHGVVSNLEFLPGMKNPPWQWFHNAVKVPDIFTAAKKAGKTTASVFWPVTGNHPDIDYLIDEYWTTSREQSFREAFARAGSNQRVLEIMDKHLPGLAFQQDPEWHPSCDEFCIRCACDIIRQFQPDLLMIHVANIDAYRHRRGLFNEFVTKGVQETDQWIGRLMSAVEQTGQLAETNLVLTSDHGQLEIKRVIHPNVILRDKGLLTTGPDGTLRQWDAYAHSTGLSALVYLSSPDKYGEVYQLLKDMRDEGIYGISEVFTREEINQRQHLDGDFAFVLETDGYTSFGEDCLRPLVTQMDHSDYRYGSATHGYLPEKGPQPFLLAKGPAFRENGFSDIRQMVDLAPTFAEILGTGLPEADGSAITEILN